MILFRICVQISPIQVQILFMSNSVSILDYTSVWGELYRRFCIFHSIHIREYWYTINCFIEVFQISDSSSDSNSGENQRSDAEDENDEEEFEVDTDSESETDDGDDADFDDIFFELSEDASNL